MCIHNPSLLNFPSTSASHPSWLSINSYFHNDLKNEFFSWIVQPVCNQWWHIAFGLYDLLKFWSWTLSIPLLFPILASLQDTSLDPLPALLTSWRIQAYYPLEMSHFLDLSDYFLLSCFCFSCKCKLDLIHINFFWAGLL